MIDLQDERASYYWTYDSVAELVSDGEWGPSVFWKDSITSYSIGDDFVAFDSPSTWTEGYDCPTYPVRFTIGSDGVYGYDDGDGTVYEAVRADSSTHVVLTGTIREPAANGMFVAVFPRRNVR